MLSGAVTKRYARGLFLAAQADGRIEAVDGELKRVADALKENPDLKSVLEHPVVAPEVKTRLVRAVFGEALHPLVARFLGMLFTRRRSGYIEALQRAYHELADEAQGRASVRVETASPLTAEQLAATVARLQEALHREVRAEVQVNPDLIAGYRLRIGNRIVDATVKGALAQFGAGLLGGRAVSAAGGPHREGIL